MHSQKDKRSSKEKKDGSSSGNEESSFQLSRRLAKLTAAKCTFESVIDLVGITEEAVSNAAKAATRAGGEAESLENLVAVYLSRLGACKFET